MRVTTTAWKAAALLLVVLLTVVWFAPAAWLADAVAARSSVRLVDAQGSFWKGSALPGYNNGRRTWVTPDRISWRVDVLPLLTGQAHVTVTTGAGEIVVKADRNSLSVSPGSAVAQAGVLTLVGAPFNTLKPGGLLRLRWDPLQLSDGQLQGKMFIDWIDAQAALSRIAPFGSYRLSLDGAGQEVKLVLATLQGPLHLEGSGTVRAAGLRFDGLAWADPAMRPALNTLLGVLGPRQGDKVVLRVHQ